MSVHFGIGTSDFAKLRQKGAHFVDKSAFASQILKSKTEVFLFPRPRRFGKTLNVSMLKSFLEDGGDTEETLNAQDARALFEGLSIEAEGDDVWRHFRRYPVISLSFKDAKEQTWEATSEALIKTLHKELRRLVARWGEAPVALEACVESSVVTRCSTFLDDLSAWLSRRSGEKVVILIDEYDAAIHSAWVNGFYDEAITFFRNFFSSGFKDNPLLFKGC